MRTSVALATLSMLFLAGLWFQQSRSPAAALLDARATVATLAREQDIETGLALALLWERRVMPQPEAMRATLAEYRALAARHATSDLALAAFSGHAAPAGVTLTALSDHPAALAVTRIRELARRFGTMRRE